MTTQEPGAQEPGRDGAERREPGLADALGAAASRSGLGQVAPGEAPSAAALLGAMGGIRGLVESIVPGVAFLVTYTVTQELLPAVLVPLGIGLLFVVARVVQRQSVMTAVAGLLGIGISALVALISGRAENNFVPGFFINAATFLAMVVSIALRWPLIGVVVGNLTGDATGWRADRAKYRVALIATWIWAGFSLLRLAVQVPLWSLGMVEALGATKLLMGVPLYAILLWVTWLLVRTVYPARAASESSSPAV